MKNRRLRYIASGSVVGLLLMGIGWGLSNFYIVVAGAVIVAASVAGLSIPMPIIP